MKRVMLFSLLVLLVAGTAWGGWEYKYTQDCGNRCRGLAVYGPNDFVVGMNHSTYSLWGIEWYHNAPVAQGAYDCLQTVWNCPIHVGETINYTWNWGIGKEYSVDQFVYHANQDKNQTGTGDSTSVLVWDYYCNPIDRLALGTQHASSEYPTACDLDDEGNVYIAWYIDSDLTPDVRTQVEVWPPRALWVNHKAPKICQLETGSYVCEGMCVNQAGTVIWATNRSSSGVWGWVRRFVGSVAGGFTQDMAFGVGGQVPCMGFVRGVDVDEEHDRIFVLSHQDVTGMPDSLYIIDATTGAMEEKLWIDDPTLYGGDTYHNSPYDVEYEPTENALYIQHYLGWYVDKWIQYGVAVNMSSFEAIGAEEQVELTWRVESEVDNAGYKIYRDGSEIAFVQGRGNSDSPLTYTWIDKDVDAGTNYTYKIANIDLDGLETMHDFVAAATPKPAASAQVPTDYALFQNYPNPFNADTHIRFTLAQPGHTTLKIYNTNGQLIRTLVNEDMAATTHEIRWDGRNDNNELVSSGIYFYRLASGSFAETKKMSFLK